MRAIKDAIKSLADAFEEGGPLEQFMKSEMEEPEHAKSAQSGDLAEFAKEEAQEPEHQKSLKEDHDLVEWGKEEDDEMCLDKCMTLSPEGKLMYGDKELGDPDAVIKHIEELKEGGVEDASSLAEDKPAAVIRIRKIEEVPSE